MVPGKWIFPRIESFFRLICYNQLMKENQQLPLIIGFVADLMFTTRIENAAVRLGYQVQWIERADQVAPLDQKAPPRQLAEHLVGPGAVLLDMLTQLQPALIIFDLGNEAIPWKIWLPLIKSVPATRRIPAICFGSHVDAETIQIAQNGGAEAVLARSRFFDNLTDLIAQYARQPDAQALATACRMPLSKLALKGLEEFNHGEYFEAHESLEEAWNEDETVGRELYRAILQVAVAYLQIERRNFKGAMKMFLRVRQWINPLPDVCRGVNVEKLRKDTQEVHAALKELGPFRMDEFNRALLRPVEYQRQVRDD
jgi:predicted metal-dependent hydrolase